MRIRDQSEEITVSFRATPLEVILGNVKIDIRVPIRKATIPISTVFVMENLLCDTT